MNWTPGMIWQSFIEECCPGCVEGWMCVMCACAVCVRCACVCVYEFVGVSLLRVHVPRRGLLKVGVDNYRHPMQYTTNQKYTRTYTFMSILSSPSTRVSHRSYQQRASDITQLHTVPFQVSNSLQIQWGQICKSEMSTFINVQKTIVGILDLFNFFNKTQKHLNKNSFFF